LEKIRAFIAVPASDEVKEIVAKTVGELKAAGASVKWVEPENVHLTLKFLGNITAEDVEKLRVRLREALGSYSSFDVTAGKVGCFPGGRRAPRVIWIGLEGAIDRLKEIAVKVDETCAGLGFDPETRPFKAHLTIGRVRRGSGGLRELGESIGSIGFKPLKLQVDRVNLVRSRLSPQGPTYTVLESIALEDS
jgi:2'-5' RNA ligase